MQPQKNILVCGWLSILLCSACQTQPRRAEALRPADLNFELDLALEAEEVSYETWLRYNHFLKGMTKKQRQGEFDRVAKQLHVNNHSQVQFKYIIVTTHVDASLDELIRAKGILNRIMRKKTLRNEERMFWELYVDSLNKAIRFNKLATLATRKYKEERLARRTLEYKIKELSKIELENEGRNNKTNKAP